VCKLQNFLSLESLFSSEFTFRPVIFLFSAFCVSKISRIAFHGPRSSTCLPNTEVRVTQVELQCTIKRFKMATGHVLLLSTIFSLLLLHWRFDSAYNAKYRSLEDTAFTWKHSIKCLITRTSTLSITNHHHLSTRCKYFKSRVPYSPKGIPSFNIYDGKSSTFLVPSPLLLSRDISPNPGPGRGCGESRYPTFVDQSGGD